MSQKIAFACGRAVGLLLRALPGLVRDLIGLSGAGSIVYGAALIYRPAGFIIGGLLVLVGVVLYGRAEANAVRHVVVPQSREDDL